MARIEITRKVCPVCGYVYERKKTYKMGYEKIAQPKHKNTILTQEEIEYAKKHPNSKINKHKIKWVISNEETEFCAEDIVTQGKEDFEYWEEEKIEPHTIRYGGPPTRIYINRYGMFCPKCGVFLNHKICTTHEEQNI